MANPQTIGELVYKISGDMDNLKTELSKSEKSVKDLEKTMQDLSKTVADSTSKSAKSTENMTTSVFKGTMAYDVFKKSIQETVGFLQDAMKESMDSAAIMQQVATNVTNAGFAFDDLSEKIQQVGDAAVQLGFDDEDASLAFSKFMVVTKDVTTSMDLLGLAQDLARAKNIDLMSATQAVILVTQGNTRALKELGVNISETASTADQLREAQEKVKDSAKNFASTTAGNLQTLQNQWANLKQEVGDKLAPVFLELFKKIEAHLPEIEKDVELVANGIVDVVKVVEKLAPILKDVAIGFAAFKLASLVVNLASVVKGITSITGAMNILKAAILSNPFGLIAAGIAVAVDQSIKLIDNIKRINAESKKFNDTNEAYKKLATLKEGTQEYNAQVAVINSLTGIRDGQLKQDQKQYDNAVATLGTLKEGTKEYKDQQKFIESLGKEIVKLGGSVDKSLFSGVNNISSSASDAAQKAVDAFNTMQDKLLDVRQKVIDLSESLRTDLVDSVKKFSDTLKDTVVNGKNDLAKIVIDAQESITETQTKLNQELSQTTEDQNADSIASLRKTIEEKQAILTAYANFQTTNATAISEIQKKIDDTNKALLTETDPQKKAALEAQIDGLNAQLVATKSLGDIDQAVTDAKKRASQDDFTNAVQDIQNKIQLATNQFIAETTLIRQKQLVANDVEQQITDFYKSQTKVRQATLDAFSISTVATLKKIGTEAKSAMEALNQLQSKQAQFGGTPEIIPTSPSTVNNASSSMQTNNSKTVNAPITINNTVQDSTDLSSLASYLNWQLSKL